MEYLELDFRNRKNNPEYNHSLTAEEKDKIISERNKLKRKITNKKYYEKRKLKK